MTLLVGTTVGAYLVDDSPEEIVGGTRINHLARLGDVWWAVDGKGRVYRDGDVVAAMPDEAAALCIQPSHDSTWIGSNEARLFTLDEQGLAEDEFFADAPGRDKWYTPWGDPADVRSMAVDADHTLYINVHVGGILRYDNTGLASTIDMSADVHQVASHPTRKGAVFAACARGLAFSHNGHDFDIRSDGLHAPYCRAVSVMEDRLLLTASTGPRTAKGRLYAGDLWEGELTPVTSGLPEWFDDNVDTHCVSATGTTAHLGFDDTVWRSDDSGSTWEVLTSGLPKITCIA
jgi:hypothetical protein